MQIQEIIMQNLQHPTLWCFVFNYRYLAAKPVGVLFKLA